MKYLFTVFAFILPLISQAAIPQTPDEVNPIEVGSKLPEVQLTAADGTKVGLRELVSEQATVIVFYRGGWCPYCNRHLAELGQIEDKLLEKGYRIIAISADRVENIHEALAKSDYGYELYSDASMEAAKAFGLAFKVDDATYGQLQNYGIDLEAASGEAHHLLPVPAVFITDSDGRITFRYFNPDYKERLSSEGILQAID